jgi:hypothetical protein
MTRRHSWPIARLHLPEPGDADRAKRLDFAGDIGETITVTGIVTRKGYVHSSRYDTLSTLVEIDCQTSVVVTFSSARWAQAVTLGEQVTVTGTVKHYDHWHGIPETVLGRTKRVDNTDTARPDKPPAAGWPVGEASVRRRFQDHPDPAAPTLPSDTADPASATEATR